MDLVDTHENYSWLLPDLEIRISEDVEPTIFVFKIYSDDAEV